jgi:putative ABC transport system permease protein
MRNLHEAIRLLWREPGFSAAAILTLALGVGANTAVFSVVDAALLRPLPYGDPARLVTVRDANRAGAGGGLLLSKLAAYRGARSLDGLAGFERMSRAMTGSGTPEQVLGEAVTANLLSVVGVNAAIGRTFRAGEDAPGAPRVVMLTDGFWRRRFDADPSVLGRTIVFNDVPHEVVGVLPPSFEPLTQPGSGFKIDFLVAELYADATGAGAALQVNAVGRLGSNVTIQQAQAELQGLSSDRTLMPVAEPLRDRFFRRNMRLSLTVMLVAVVLVLLVACVNLGNLLLVHAIARQREIATRVALGASRGEIARNLATRGLLLGAFGGAAGLAGGVWIRSVLVAMAPLTIPGLHQPALNSRVLAFTIACSLLAGIAASLLPMLHFSHHSLATTIGGSGRSTGTRAATRWQSVLLSTEIAAAVVLTVAAALLVQSHTALNRVPLGFRTDNILMFTVRLPATRYPDSAARLTFFETLERRLATLDGVQSVAVTDAFPMRGGDRASLSAPRGSSVRADFQLATPGYFAALRIPIERGRAFDTGDRAGANPVAIVSQTLVQRVFGSRDPIGEIISLESLPQPLTIVGVVGEVRRDGPETFLAPQVYLPAGQSHQYVRRLAEVGILSSGDPLALIPAVRDAVASIDPVQPITHVQKLDDVLAGATAPQRFNTTLIAALAALAVTLAAVGIFGVVSHAAANRRKEIGIRIALGAQRRQILTAVVAGSAVWACGGIAAGLLIAYAGAGVLSGLLFGIPATDPATFAGAIAFVLVVALVATLLPAHRASRMDPLSTLRAD